MTLHLARKVEAQNLLHEAEFRRRWEDLYKKCPWATVFQNAKYVEIWNKHFKNDCELILLYETDEKGNLVGLFPLSRCLKTNKIFVAGDFHSEYQTWLALEENGNDFIQKALSLLQKEFPKCKLQLMFLAPNSPLEWLEGKWGEQTNVNVIPRPLVALDERNTAAKSLRKKGNKTRIRQLKKRGELQFEEIKSHEEFEEIFDQIENYSHLRLSALHNVQSELNDVRKAFHIDLMKQTDLIYPTLLKVDEKIASAQVCFRNKDEMLLCITSMSPFFAKQSPSKIHLLMLGQKLTETDYETFDLSPGNGYKTRFATHSKEVHTLTIFFEKSAYLRHKVKRKFVKFGRESLENLKFTKTRVFKLADRIRHKLQRVKYRTVPYTILKNIARKIYEHKECRIYSFDMQNLDLPENPQKMTKNSVEDLLKYRPTEGWQETTSQFHQKVLCNFEAGIHSYTYSENETLLHYGWLIENQKVSNVYEVEQKFNLPPNTAVLFDYYTHPKARRMGLYQKSLLQGLHDAAKNPDVKQVFIGTLADNLPSRHVIEKLGFKYEGSLFKETKFGSVKKWQDWDKESQIEHKEIAFEESYST